MVHAGVLGALLAASAGVSAQTVFLETFGNTATRSSSSYVPSTSGAGAVSYYKYADPTARVSGGNLDHQRELEDGYYAVINPQNLLDPLPPSASTSQTGRWWDDYLPAGTTYTSVRDHTGDGGAVLVVNAGNTVNHVYRRLVTLVPGTTYDFTAWTYYVLNPGQTQLSLRQPNDSATLASSPLYTVVDSDTRRVWVQRTWKFTVPANCGNNTQYAAAFSNLSRVTRGNDLFIDDISLTATTVTAGATVAPCGNDSVQPTVTTEPDFATTLAGTAVLINVASNDRSSNAAGAPLGAPHFNAGTTSPAHGTVSIVDGQVRYTPNPGFTGTDTFTYEICTTASTAYPTASCRVETVTVNVLGVTTTPDAASTTTNTPTTINVRSNDASSHPDLAPLATPTTVTPPANGTVTWVDGNALYAPNTGFNGTDTFTYQVCTTGTPSACSAATTVTVTVTPTVATTPDTASTAPNTPVSINVLANDSSTAPLGTPTTVGPPANGTVSWVNGQAVYTPTPGFTGTDTFTYQVCTTNTPAVCSLPTTVTVTVAAPAPVPADAPWALAALSLGIAAFAARRARRAARRDH